MIFHALKFNLLCGENIVFWTPKVDKSFESLVNSEFESMDLGIEMYIKYAQKAGFNCRLGSEKFEK